MFGYPGDGINGFLGAFEKVEEPVFKQTRHEEMAAFMACAHAKFTGEIGVCMATSGPGTIHLHDANRRLLRSRRIMGLREGEIRRVNRLR